MSFTVEATYENGVLKLRQPLPLDEHETVRVTVQTDKSLPIARMESAAMAPVNASSPDEPSDLAEHEMVDIWLNVPPSSAAITVIATRGEPILPGPFEIDESDLAPE